MPSLGENRPLDLPDNASGKTLRLPLGVLRGSTLTLCDPSYLTDARGRLEYGDADERRQRHGPYADAAVDEEPLADGEWSAYVVVGDQSDGWGRRVWWSGIQLEGHERSHGITQVEQGVDSGMIGYFIDRPAMVYDDVVTLVHDGRGVGFCRNGDASMALVTNSGYGDGVHQAVVAWRDDKIVFVLLDLR